MIFALKITFCRAHLQHRLFWFKHCLWLSEQDR